MYYLLLKAVTVGSSYYQHIAPLNRSVATAPALIVGVMIAFFIRRCDRIDEAIPAFFVGDLHNLVTVFLRIAAGLSSTA